MNGFAFFIFMAFNAGVTLGSVCYCWTARLTVLFCCLLLQMITLAKRGDDHAKVQAMAFLQVFGFWDAA